VFFPLNNAHYIAGNGSHPKVAYNVQAPLYWREHLASPPRIIMKRLCLCFCVLLIYARGEAQTLTSVGTSSVVSANDFATTAFQDPWDMNERTDLGWFLNSVDQPGNAFTSVSFANGVFSGTNATNGNVFLLESANPNAARVGKIGRNYPLDANTQRLMAFRVSTSATSATFFQWNRDTIYDNTTSRSNSITTGPGYRFYLADMVTLGSAPSGAAAPFPWGGTIKSLWMFFTSPGTVLMDWVRLVDVQPSLCRTITWTGPSTVDIYLDDNTVASDGNLGAIALAANAGGASPGCSGTAGSTYRYYAGALPAGTYHVGVVSSGGSTTNVNYGTGVTPWVVNGTPTLTFTSPSEEGSSDDFATTFLSNAWDMSAVSDFDLLTNVTNPHIEGLAVETPAGTSLGVQNVFRATSAAATGGAVGDPYVDPLFVNGRGFNSKIDTNRYRILTFEFGIPDKPRDILNGSIARIVWRVNGEAGENVSDDIIFSSRSGANVLNKVIVDMADRNVLPLEPGSPSGWNNGSTSKPGLDIFRVDPHEFDNPTDFFIKRIKLAALEKTSASYTIRWTFSEPSGSVNLYWDNDASGFDGTLIQPNINAAAGQYTWNASGLATPTATNYYIYAVFDDGAGASNQVYAKWPIVIDSTYRPLPRIVISRPTLNFGVAFQNRITSTQTVRVTVVGSGSPCWTVDDTGPSTDFIVTNGSGCGNGSFTVALKNQSYFANGTGETTLRVRNASGANTFDNSPQYVHAWIRITAAGSAPVGVVDTPAAGAAVSGSIPVTGWVVDDVDVMSVAVYRSPVAGEGSGDVFIGNAVRVDDARPDIESVFPNSPFNYRTGWGYLMLTNFLPNGGNGSFVLKVFATDREGNRTLIGSRSIVGQNSTAFGPFGAIDTPDQGETVSGTIANFGWVLAQGPALASPGSSPAATVTVVVDGVGIGTPGGWTSRGDLTALFPAATYPGVNKALGVFGFDTTVYANGVHTIAWGVTANNGLSDGIGSRYFTVVNGSGLTRKRRSTAQRAAPTVVNPGPDLGRRAADVASLDMNTSIVSGHSYGYRPATQRVEADATGRRVVFGHEIERVVVDASSAGASRYEAYSVVDGQLRGLPIGASFDSTRGILYWQPGVGFTGNYDFVILTSGNQRIPVRIVLQPHRSRVRPNGRSWNFALAADHVLRATCYVLQPCPSL
jgi:hypothetical protein